MLSQGVKILKGSDCGYLWKVRPTGDIPEIRSDLSVFLSLLFVPKND